VLPMHRPGVTVRPLRQMNHHASFNEVFLSDARIPGDWVVGEVGQGWSAALTTLAHERRFGAMGRQHVAERGGRVHDEARAEADRHFAAYTWYPQRAGRVDLLVERARDVGDTDDPVTRQRIARTMASHRTASWTAQRARAARHLGTTPGAEGSVGKLAMSVVARSASEAHAAIAGASGMLCGDDAPLAGTIAEILLSVPAQSIAGGTDEIQRNILAERALGLPREPATDRDIPYRDAPRNM